MKKQLLIFALLTLTTSISLFAQSNYYYYYKGKKVFLNLDKSSLYIHTDNTFQKSSLSNQNLLDYTLKTENNISTNEIKKWSIINFENEPNDLEYYQKINSIKSINTVNVVAPSFTTLNNKKVVLSRLFYVKLKQASDINKLQQKANEYNLIIKNQSQFNPLWYYLVCTKNTVENTLNVANAFYETGLFSSSSPSFISIIPELQQNPLQNINNQPLTSCVNDEYFDNQWNLDSTGQLVSTNPNINSTIGLDIKACEAWNITTGNNSINIAVIDHGVELSHPDLTNIHPLSYDTENGTSPSVVYGPHGTQCGGIIGAEQNNTIGLSGIAPDCKLMSISATLVNPIKIAEGINWAWQNEADVISNSWGLNAYDPIIEIAIEDALTLGRDGKGCIVVFSSGNSEGTITEFPANSDERLIVVGALSPCGERANPNSCDDQTWWGSAYGQKLDIMAPGTFIPTTELSGNAGWEPGDYDLDFLGTSAAAGLILSVNPNLTNIEVNNIIESTAQKVNKNTGNNNGLYTYETHLGRPNGTWNNEMGYGLLDAYASVVLAQNMNTSVVDLYTKDTPLDFGIEPNTSSNYTFLSQDIWVRHQQDGLTNFTHQTPITNTNNYVYVKVRNKGADASIGNEKLHLYWSSQGLIWPNHWINHYGNSLSNQTPVLYGDEVGSVTIPSIASGQEAILEFNMDFNPPFPGLYGSYYKLLTRIVSTNDAIISETSNIHDNILNNNNIASKSVYVSNDNAPFSRSIHSIHNPTDIVKTYRLEFIADATEYGKAIYNEAEIHIELNQELYNAWNSGGKQGSNFKLVNNENSIIVTNNNFVLDNITLQPNQHYSLDATFHFLTKELTNKNQFNYKVAQYDKNDNSLIDITHIRIQKETRTPFLADAGNNLEIDKNETITISAEQINEAAIYNWYDTDGNLVYTGKDLTVSADVTKKYKLEIVAESDGFKDYDEVDIKVNQFYLNNIVPNPATNNVVINYKTIDAASAYLMVIGTNTNTSNNYIINTNQEQVALNISNYPIGYYTIALVCNGNIVDAKTLIKN